MCRAILTTTHPVASRASASQPTLPPSVKDHWIGRICIVWTHHLPRHAKSSDHLYRIRKAVPPKQTGPVIAVKFINKEHAFRAGRLRPKQLKLELTLHQSVCPHENIIRFLSWGEDANWVYMCLELADGGDLFDKIEADEGVAENIAHLYFVQLCGAIGWCHGKGVAHRDIKPENMLLSSEGNLKLADFGLATQYVVLRTGEKKRCGMVCGSPPYIAPEILEVGNTNMKRKQGEDKVGYEPQVSDVWSCAIVLFVLLAGNTPWDCPDRTQSYEFHEYVKSGGRPQDELWEKVPAATLSLVRGMLKVDPKERFTLHEVMKHPWFTRQNPEINEKNQAARPVELATQMLESLRIDFNADISASQQQQQRKQQQHSQEQQNQKPMDLNPNALHPGWAKFVSTQPETPISDTPFDWEAPPRPGAVGGGISASQPTNHDRMTAGSATQPTHTNRTDFLRDVLAEDPSMSQFSQVPISQMTATQQARRFRDIVPSHSLTRFLSHLPFASLLPMLVSALHRLNIPVTSPSASALEGREEVVTFRVKTVDARQQALHGSAVVEKVSVGSGAGEVLEVRFLKAKGDPVGWRRLFKQVVVLCRDAIPRQ